jgi:hypothetical protein
MSVEFQTVTLQLEAQKDAPGDVTATTDSFSNVVLDAEACIKSWELSFPRSDHEFHKAFVKITEVSVTANNKKVQVTGRLGLRDDSGTWDDTYAGTAEVLVIARLANN